MVVPEEVLAPISEESPGGTDLRYTDFQSWHEIEESLRSGESKVGLDLTDADGNPVGVQVQQADFKRARALIETALSEKTKDVELGVRLIRCLLHEEGVAGVADGLHVLRVYLTDFWDHVHPGVEEEEPEYRIGPLETLAEDLPDEINNELAVDAGGNARAGIRRSRDLPSFDEAEADPEKKEKREKEAAHGTPMPEEVQAGFDATSKEWYREALEACDRAIEEVGALSDASDEKFGRQAPSFRKLREALDGTKSELQSGLERRLEIDPDPVDVSSSEGGGHDGDGEQETESAGSGGGGPAAVSATIETASAASSAVDRAARFLRQADPTDPAPYFMLRGLRWGELRRDGETIDPRKLEAPPTDVRTRLKGQLLDGHWAPLLESAEQLMGTSYGRGWLDLQRYAATACDGLGPGYEGVKNAIVSSLRTLLREFPDLATMTLMDDSPTANSETRRWLANEGISNAPLDDLPAAPAHSGADDADRVIQQAQQRAEAGFAREAAQTLSERARFARSARDRFMMQSHATRLMLAEGMGTVALPMLEDLSRLIQQHELEGWESHSVVSLPLALLYQAMEETGQHALASDPAVTRDALFQRICRLDPSRAMELETREPEPTAEPDAAAAPTPEA